MKVKNTKNKKTKHILNCYIVLSSGNVSKVLSIDILVATAKTAKDTHTEIVKSSGKMSAMLRYGVLIDNRSITVIISILDKKKCLRMSSLIS